MVGQVSANPVTVARQRVQSALSGGGITNPVTANDVRDAIRAIVTLPPNDARTLIAELSRNGSLSRLASEVMDTSWFGNGGITADERASFFATVAQTQNGATLAQLSAAFASSDAAPSDKNEAIHNLAFAVSVHASPQARLDYVNNISGAITAPQATSQYSFGTAITTYSDAEASALATVLPTLQRGQAAAVLTRLSDVQLSSVLRSGVGETTVRTSAMMMGGISASTSSWNPSGFAAILSAASGITDPAQRARITSVAAAEYMVTLQASSNFGHTLIGQRETLAQMRSAIGQFSGRAAMRDLPEAAAGAPVTREALLLDVTQMSLDIIGIVEPTPFADGTNALISAGRGDAVGAVLSGLGIIPYLGDLAKIGKLGRWAQTMENAIQLAKTDPAFRAAIEPALSRIRDGLELASGAIGRISDSARATLNGMKAKLDDLLGPSGTASDDAARQTVDDFHLREPEADFGAVGRQEVLLDSGRRALGDLPLNSTSLDELYQAGRLSMDEARALAKNANWRDANGDWIYPPNNGFDGGFTSTRLIANNNVIIDRYGRPSGQFVSPAGSSQSSRALPPDTDFSSANYHIYRVSGNMSVLSGRATAWFDEVGGATQYRLDQRISDLILQGKLVEITR